MNDVIGEVKAVHFEWMLSTYHGADYFRRWHRDKRNSGGLLVHKSTHHFDLVNFWLNDKPKTVFAFGDFSHLHNLFPVSLQIYAIITHFAFLCNTNSCRNVDLDYICKKSKNIA